MPITALRRTTQMACATKKVSPLTQPEPCVCSLVVFFFFSSAIIFSSLLFSSAYEPTTQTYSQAATSGVQLKQSTPYKKKQKENSKKILQKWLRWARGLRNVGLGTSSPLWWKEDLLVWTHCHWWRYVVAHIDYFPGTLLSLPSPSSSFLLLLLCPCSQATAVAFFSFVPCQLSLPH